MEKEIIHIIPGAFVLVMGLFNLYRALVKRKWPETIGKIQKNEIRQITIAIYPIIKIGMLNSYNTNPGSSKKQKLILNYVYVVDGGKYTGNQLYSAPIIETRRRLVGLYVGDKVKVFYNPKNPAKSFLAHSFAWPSLVVIFIGLALIAGGVYMQLNQ
ncbi:hypothetical protein MAH1_06930 [Sessilibacter sp. MAH1]